MHTAVEAQVAAAAEPVRDAHRGSSSCGAANALEATIVLRCVRVMVAVTHCCR